MARPSDSQSTSTSRKRKSQDSESEEGSPQKRSNVQKYSYLKPQTRHISQEQIRAEWKSLPKPARQQVRDIFLAAKRTTLNQVTEGTRRREAEFVVTDVLRRLEKQLPRMPFPPGTKVGQLDLDGILEQVRVLEAEKIPLNDSVKLLEDEIQREEERIEMKRKELARLEKESKVASKLRKQRATKTHALLVSTELERATGDDADSIGLVTEAPAAELFNEPDEDIAPLLSQLRDHLASINANIQQVAGVDEEISRTRAALASVIPPQST